MIGHGHCHCYVVAAVAGAIDELWRGLRHDFEVSYHPELSQKPLTVQSTPG